MWMQVCLGFHALVGVMIGLWAIRVGYSTSPDFLFPERPGFGPTLTVILWFFAWWAIARLRPMPRYVDQPVARFNKIPAILVLAIQVPVCIWFMRSFTTYGDMGRYMLW